MNTQQLKNTILQEAIQGRLVPQDPTDEPASVLLQRIRKEKERLVKEGKLKKKDLESKPIGADEIPFEIPKGWEWVRLKDISESILYGVSESAKVNGRYKLLRITDIQNNNVEWESVPYTDFDEIKAKNYFLQKNDILFARTGGTVGKSYLVDDCPEDSIYASYLIRVRLIISVYSRYIKSFFESPAYWSQITDNLSGTGQPNCNGEKLSNLLIPLPPLSEQRRIVAKIEELLPLVEQYGKAQAELDNLNRTLPDKLKKSVLQKAIQGRLVPQDANDEPASELLKRIHKEKERLVKEGKLKKKDLESKPIENDENPFEIPKGWEWCRLGNLALIARGGSPRPIKDYLTTESDGYNWIKIGDTEKEGKFINHTTEKIKREGLGKTRLIHPGDFLLTNSMSFGRPYISNIEGCIHDGWLVISQYCEVFDRDYLYYLLSSNYAFSQFRSKVSGAVVQNLNSDKVADSIFPLPPLPEQHRIVAKIEELFKKIDGLKG